MADNSASLANSTASGAATGASVGGPWGAVAGGAIGLAGGLAGQNAVADNNAQAAQILKDLYAKYGSVAIPTVEQQQLNLGLLSTSGQYTPQQLQTLQLSGHDAMQDIQTDPRLQQAQMDQLQTLSKLGNTSFSADEKAQLDAMNRNVASSNTARLQQILQQQDQRGMGGSGASLQAQLANSQQAANEQQTQTENMQAQAMNRALQAKMGAGQLGTQMQANAFGQQAQVANALNNRQIANFNVANQTQASNVANANQAQQYNLQNQQNIANQNVGLQNSQQQYNKQLYQQQYANQMNKLAGMSGQGGTLATNYMNNGAMIGQGYANMAAGGGKIATGIGQYMNQPAAKVTPGATGGAAPATGDNQALDTYTPDSYSKQNGGMS